MKEWKIEQTDKLKKWEIEKMEKLKKIPEKKKK